MMKLLNNCLKFVAVGALLITCNARSQAGAAPAATETLPIDAHATSAPFPHFWEQTFGSGRAILSLREGYRNDLRAVKAVTSMKAVRFHGIFLDDVGLYDPDRQAIQFAQMTGTTNTPTAAGPYNFSYVDQIYDGLLANGVHPFVELSFTPKKMATDPSALHPFWYHQNVSPPDYTKWDPMIAAFAQHLIARYGIEEVAQWNFEVWNEPNIDFWGGTPKQPTYFELYAHTARALKAVNPRLRIGGPATAQAAWVGEFLAFCKQNNLPVDFASTHVYANDTAPNVFQTAEVIPRENMVCRSVKKVHDEIAASPFPSTPLYFSEYNASYANEPNVTDSTYMAAWLPSTIAQCDGLIKDMAYWSFSDVFEEQGVIRTPFYGGFGLIAEDGIPKPVFNTFTLLHKLGTERLALASRSALLTRAADGHLVLALWNYTDPIGTGAEYTPETATNRGPARTFHLTGMHGRTAELSRVDPTHGNVVAAFDAMGRPATPSREQIVKLREAGKLAAAEHVRINAGALDVKVPAQGFVLLEIGK